MGNQFSEIRRLLTGVVHPESGKNIVESGILEDISQNNDILTVTLSFPKARDPFTNSIRRQVKEAIETAFPQMRDNVVVFVKEAPPKQKSETKKPKTTTSEIKHIVAISSAKGGVGKSTVAANLAVTLSKMGFRVGLLDADIYGPSQPKMFGVEDYRPTLKQKGEGEDEIVPAQAYGIKLMSIAFFINENDALVWRGPMASNALKQMIHQTEWGELDFLLIDLPPGTGDVHLTLLSELRVSGAIVVSTPQQIALADVVRGLRMFRSPTIEIPVFGIVENMAWFTPAELPDNKYYIFGCGGVQKLAEKENLEILGQIPIMQSVMEGCEAGTPSVDVSPGVENYYAEIARKIVDKVGETC